MLRIVQIRVCGVGFRAGDLLGIVLVLGICGRGCSCACRIENQSIDVWFGICDRRAGSSQAHETHCMVLSAKREAISVILK